MIRSLLFVLVLALAGCSSTPRTDSRSAASPEHGSTTAAAPAGDQPVLLEDLTDQREVWDCQKCGMIYDREGMCSMCSVALVRTKVDYSCAADGKPVERGDKCPRCDVPVVVTKTAIAATLDVPALGGK